VFIFCFVLWFFVVFCLFGWVVGGVWFVCGFLMWGVCVGAWVVMGYLWIFGVFFAFGMVVFLVCFALYFLLFVRGVCVGS